MKFHFHPVSTTCRPIMMLCAEAKIAYEPVVVDVMSGAHKQEPFISMNPSSQIPVLEDGDFVLTESSAILKYLSEKAASPFYPKDLKARARVNERMDWFNTGMMREYCYHMVYPQIFGHHTRTPEAAQTATVEWGKAQAERWLKVLDEKILGKHKYVCGDEVTIADFFGADIIHTGTLTGVSLKRFANVERWMAAMRALPSWGKVHEAVDGFAASLKDKKFVAVQ
jgi:glutathione S-transferase